jgi:hypothetical protein
VGAGVDAEGHAADHGQSGGGEVAAEAAGDLAAVAGGAAGADERDGVGRKGKLGEQARLTAADQSPGRVGQVAQASRVERVVAADGPATSALEVVLEAALGKSFDLGDQAAGGVGGNAGRQVLVFEAEQVGGGSAPSETGALHIGSEAGEQLGAAQADGAGVWSD